MMAIVSVRGLVRQYEQAGQTVRALDGVDLDVATGEFTALMGPSGSGKTTLLNAIGGLDRPDAGEVVVDGVSLGGLGKTALSDLRLHRIGFIFQSYNLVPVLTAYENAEFVLLLQGVAPAERRARVLATLDAVGLSGLADRYPGELSGGQQQRVAVARAIAGRPALVLADEPTANLDSKTGAALIALMRDLNQTQGVTFLFATHDPKVQAAARRVVTLVDGRIAEDVSR
jgi:putative ABC transport system ATP-binding protein